jgi:hypothetical protein
MTEKFDPKAKGFKEIAWIPVKNISVVWAQSQRPLNEAHAKRIAANFDPEMFGTLAVTKPNGRGIYHAIDGHHRKVAVETIWGGEEKVPCQVFDAEDPARAAELFDHINSTRKNPAPIELFKVRVTAGCETEVAVDKIVRKCGYVIGSARGRTESIISCVAALRAVYLSYGGTVLEASINLARAIWGPDDESAVQAFIVRGFGEFLSEHRDVEFKRLRETMAAKYTPARLVAAAKVGKEMHGGTIPAEVKKLMVNCYNHGLRAGSDRKLKSKVQEA